MATKARPKTLILNPEPLVWGLGFKDSQQENSLSQEVSTDSLRAVLDRIGDADARALAILGLGSQTLNPLRFRVQGS